MLHFPPSPEVSPQGPENSHALLVVHHHASNTIILSDEIITLHIPVWEFMTSSRASPGNPPEEYA